MECGAEVPLNQAYIEAGGHVCQSCQTASEVREGFANPYKSMGVSSISAALLSWCFNPFGVFTIVSIGASIGALTYPKYLDDDQKDMLRELSWVKALAIISLLIAVPRGLLEILMIFGIFASL